MRNTHTTDHNGFNFMTNSGMEERDRDICGTLIAVFLIAVLTLFQYAGWY